MSNKTFNPIELDAIGEIMNISLGSSATAVSNMLDHRVDITTPKVSVIRVADFTLGDLEPAVGVEIQYVTGLEGSNLMLLKMSDVKVIVDILMGMETPEEEFELNDLTLSAVCEVMNQMMGSAATALSDFLGKMVNISTPTTFDGDNVSSILKDRLPDPTATVVVVEFSLSIEGSMESRFMNVMSVKLAKELIAGFGLGEDEDEQPEPEPAPAPEPSGGVMSQEEIERMMGGMSASAPPSPAPASSGGVMSQEEIERMMGGMQSAPPSPAPPPAASSSGGVMSQEEIERMMSGMSGNTPPSPAPAPAQAQAQQVPGPTMPMSAQNAGAPAGQYPPPPYYPYYGMDPQQMQMMYPPMYYMPPAGYQPTEDKEKEKENKNKVIQTKAVSMPKLQNETELNEEQAQNLDLIMGVPLEIAVEIGRTRKKVQEILNLSKGSLVVLDKLAGDQVDVFVNGKCIAHGDVVVIDDNFGIRINEILSKPGLADLT